VACARSPACSNFLNKVLIVLWSCLKSVIASVTGQYPDRSRLNRLSRRERGSGPRG
jgi:hypothetical protein